MRLREALGEPQRKTGTFYYAPRRDKLPEDMVRLFDRLGKAQRSGAELVMARITREYPLMWFGFLLEHMGDLIHATSDCVNFDGAIVRDVEQKLQNASRTLSRLQPNLQDLAKQNKLEAEKRGMTERDYVREIMRELQKYVQAHYSLPAYNHIHILCKRITTSLGAMEFEECKRHVDEMLKYSKDGSLNRRALTITRDRQGRIVEM